MISIIIPNYNKSNYIVESIDSVKEQTSNNWECIIIDDCSTDNSVLTIKSVIKNDDRFKLYINNKNSGANYCRNLGILESKSDYVMFLDADDLLHQHCIKSRLKFIFKHTHLSFAVFPMGTFYNKIGDSVNVWNRFKGNLLNRFLAHDLPWAICSVVWKKLTLIKLGCFDESFIRLQDVELHTRALLYKNIKYQVKSENDVDCYYRINNNKIDNYDNFLVNDIKGKMQYISSFKNINIRNKKYLKGTFFECLNNPLVFFKKGYIGKQRLLELKLFVFENKALISLNKLDLMVLEFYFKIRFFKIYFKGMNSFFKFLFIRKF